MCDSTLYFLLKIYIGPKKDSSERKKRISRAACDNLWQSMAHKTRFLSLSLSIIIHSHHDVRIIKVPFSLGIIFVTACMYNGAGAGWMAACQQMTGTKKNQRMTLLIWNAASLAHAASQSGNGVEILNGRLLCLHMKGEKYTSTYEYYYWYQKSEKSCAPCIVAFMETDYFLAHHQGWTFLWGLSWWPFMYIPDFFKQRKWGPIPNH